MATGVLAAGNESLAAPARPAPSLDLGYRFEANQGQLAGPVRYLARGRGHGLFVTKDGATLALRRPGGTQAVVTMRLHGGRPVEPHGLGELPGKSNYFVGDRSTWRTGVPAYARVRQAGVLPGVDLELYGTDDRQAEYDLVLAPGADPGRVVLVFEGLDGITLARDGSAVLALAGGGEIRKPLPVVYQTGEDGARTPVAARYQRRGKDRLGFVVGHHDRRRPLVIDPVFAYATLLGGPGNERAQAVAVDGAGNAYLVGYTTSTSFPVVAPFQGSNKNPGEGNVFVAKLGPSGAPALVYATYLGGSAPAAGDRAFGVAVDAAGNAYVTGETSATDFPTAAALQPTLKGFTDAFVTKLDAAGSALLYSTYLGGDDADVASGIAVDAAGNAYLTGQTQSGNFPVKLPALQGSKGTPAGTNTVFVSKLNATGSTLTYSTFLGGNTEELSGNIAVDGAGNAYVTGTTGSGNFPKVAPLQATFAGPYDGFVSKLNPAGAALVYSTYLGGAGSDFGSAIAVDGAGSAYVTGFTTSSSFPIKTPAIQAANNAATGLTGFVSKLNAAGSTLTYSTYLGGTVQDVPAAIAVDSAGNAYVTGYTTSPDFRAVAAMQTFGGEQDAFVSKLNPAGSALVFSTHLGGAGNDSGTGIAADASGSAFVSGETLSWNFSTPGTALQPFLAGDADAFLVKLAVSGTFPPIKPKTKSDAIVVTANATTSSACGGVAFNSARTLTVTDGNGDGLVCPGCSGSSYAPADALDFIRLAFYGVHHDAARTRNCGSDVRRTLLALYNNLFQTTCAAGTCAGKPVRHLWRLPETSASIATLNALLGTTSNQFCNVHTATVIAAQGTDFLDNDPIRTPCSGNGKTGEQVCGNAAEGKLANLGMLLTVFLPSLDDTGDVYPVNYCTPGAIALLPATRATYTGLCPAGNPSFGGKCFASVYRTTNPDGSFNTDANCIQHFQTGACPTLTPAGTDCRGANLWLRDPTGAIVKDTTFEPGMVPPNTGRLITGAFYKIHATVKEANGTAVCGTAEAADPQIACLAGDADPCTIGFTRRKGLGLPLPATMAGVSVNGVAPDDAGVHYGTYPLSF